MKQDDRQPPEFFSSRLARVSLALVPLVIAAVAWMFVEQMSIAAELRGKERASVERRMILADVLSAHQDIETGQRGFVITGDESFLAPYTEGSRRLDSIFALLERDYADDPDAMAEVATIERLSQEKRALSAANLVARRRPGGHDVAERLIASGRGKTAMDNLRQHIGRLRDLEDKGIAQVRARSAGALWRFRATYFGLITLLAGLLVAAGVAIYRMFADRRAALAELADTSARRAAILNGAMDGIVTLNPSGTIESVNAAALRMFGYKAGEMIGRDVGILYATQPPIGRVAEVLRGMDLRAGEPGSIQEIEVGRKDGSTFSADVAVTLAQLGLGRRYIAVIRDVTERKQIEQMKTEFIATVSHELRTPLTSIAGSLGLLEGGAAGQMDTKVGRLVSIARTNADRLVRLINDILDIEKLESGRMRFDNRPVNLVEAARDAIVQANGYAQRYDVSVELRAAGKPLLVLADPDRLAQVITNLLSNAIKFSPPGATVTVTLAAGTRNHRLTVSDRGPGIPDEFRDRIFGKFAQADGSDTRTKGGTGLGLSIVKEIVSRLGGQIGYDSRPGEGAQFHVHLPVLEPEAAGASTDTRTRLLLGCDETLRWLVDELEQAHYHVDVAQSAVEVSERLKHASYDVAVIDMAIASHRATAMLQAVRATDGGAQLPVLTIGGGHRFERGEVDSLLHQLAQATGTRAASSIRILHVDDDSDVLRIVSEAFAGHARMLTSTTMADARVKLRTQPIDALILDLTLRDGAGIDLLPDTLRKDGSRIPVIVFSAEDPDPASAHAFDAFMTKARTPLPRLVSTVSSLVKRHAGANG